MPIKVVSAFEKTRKSSVIEEVVNNAIATTAKNDRALTEAEIDFERQAEKLDILSFPRIHPRRGTIGFMVRGMDGGNHQAIEFLRCSLPPNASSLGSNKNIFNLILQFDNLDEASKGRVDALDHLCRKHHTTPIRFLEAVTNGIKQYHDLMATAVIAAEKPELAARVMNFAKDKKQMADRRLAAEMSGLVGQNPTIQVNTGKQVKVEQNVVLSFSDFAKEQDKLRHPKQLEAGDENTVDGEIVEELGVSRSE